MFSLCLNSVLLAVALILLGTGVFETHRQHLDHKGMKFKKSWRSLFEETAACIIILVVLVGYLLGDGTGQPSLNLKPNRVYFTMSSFSYPWVTGTTKYVVLAEDRGDGPRLYNVGNSNVNNLEPNQPIVPSKLPDGSYSFQDQNPRPSFH